MKLFKLKDKPLTAAQVANLSPERIRIAQVLKKHIDAAILEIGSGYDVDLQGSFAATPLQVVVTVKAVDSGEIP